MLPLHLKSNCISRFKQIPKLLFCIDRQLAKLTGSFRLIVRLNTNSIH